MCYLHLSLNSLVFSARIVLQKKLYETPFYENKCALYESNWVISIGTIDISVCNNDERQEDPNRAVQITRSEHLNRVPNIPGNAFGTNERGPSY